MDTQESTSKFRGVKGQFNPMAVCSACSRDATQTRMSFYCIDTVKGVPLLCDDCRQHAARMKEGWE